MFTEQGLPDFIRASFLSTPMVGQLREAENFRWPSISSQIYTAPFENALHRCLFIEALELQEFRDFDVEVRRPLVARPKPADYRRKAHMLRK